MRQHHRVGIVTLLAMLVGLSGARGEGFLIFQHGARATGQVGALTARADDASAVTYNPAGITELDGAAVLAGIDLLMPSDEYEALIFTIQGRPGATTFETEADSETLPSVYLTWRPGDSRFALGLGLDAPMWSSIDWRDSSFPGARTVSRYDVEILDVHPVVAYRIGDRMSLGLGLHFYTGELRDDNRNQLAVGRNPGTFFVDGDRSSQADVDGTAFDLALHYRRPGWGIGAVLRSGAELDGRSRNRVSNIDPVPTGYEQIVASAVAVLEELPQRLEFELAPELRLGVWRQLTDDVALELDLAFAAWSDTDNAIVRLRPGCGEPPNCPQRIERDWDDTVSLRAAAQWQVAPLWSVSGGLAYEPTPVPSEQTDFRFFRGDPGFPRGDAWVGGLGLSRDFDSVSVDVAYSVHVHSDRTDRGGDVYSSEVGRASLSMRWRL